jgi:formiminotetrahydrofolate cyclodeaminase
VVGRAEELRARAEPLADEDADAYGSYLAARTDENIERIIAIPFELATIAADVAELAAAVATEGNPNVSGDAAAGAELAAAVVAIAARLVEINARDGDPRVAETRGLAAAASEAAARAAVSDVS